MIDEYWINILKDLKVLWIVIGLLIFTKSVINYPSWADWSHLIFSMVIVSALFILLVGYPKKEIAELAQMKEERKDE